MSNNLNRRNFIKKSVIASTSAAAIGMSFEEKNLLANESATVTPPEPATDSKGMPMGKIGNLNVSRIFAGGNLISGFAHSRDLMYVSSLLNSYFTDEKVMETFEMCEEMGINTAILRLDDHCIRIINKYWNERGGKLQWIAQVKMKESDITGEAKRAIDNGAVGAYLHGGIGHTCPNFEAVLRVGLGGMKAEIERQLAGCDPSVPEDIKKREFYQSELIVLEGLIGYCRRYAQLAIEQAKHASAERRVELMRIAENCAHVATETPRSFWEALQLVEFIYNSVMIESNGHSVSYGRMDQFLYPYYEADKAAGVEKEFQQELIETFYLKMAEMCKLRDWGTVAMNGGHGMGGTTITLGGVDRQNNDATNDLTYMMIDGVVSLADVKYAGVC